MAYISPRDPETLEDQQRYTQARLVEVSCLDCLVRVRVKKNSNHHTSIQWTAQAVAECAEFTRMAASPEGRRVHAHCSRLAASIEHAVHDGDVTIGAEDGY